MATSLSLHVRCTLCGVVFPGGWFRLPNVPNSAMLLHHLGNDHLAEAKPYLKRMETEEIDEVANPATTSVTPMCT